MTGIKNKGYMICNVRKHGQPGFKNYPLHRFERRRIRGSPQIRSVCSFSVDGKTINRGTQRGYNSKPLKHSIVKRILLFKR